MSLQVCLAVKYTLATLHPVWSQCVACVVEDRLSVGPHCWFNLDRDGHVTLLSAEVPWKHLPICWFTTGLLLRDVFPLLRWLKHIVGLLFKDRFIYFFPHWQIWWKRLHSQCVAWGTSHRPNAFFLIHFFLRVVLKCRLSQWREASLPLFSQRLQGIFEFASPYNILLVLLW